MKTIDFKMSGYEWELNYNESYEFCFGYRINGGHVGLGKVEDIVGTGMEDIRSNMSEKDLALLKLRQLKGEENLIYTKDGIDLVRGYTKITLDSRVPVCRLVWGGGATDTYINVAKHGVDLFFRRGDELNKVVLRVWRGDDDVGYKLVPSLCIYCLDSEGRGIESSDYRFSEGVDLNFCEIARRFSLNDSEFWFDVKMV